MLKKTKLIGIVVLGCNFSLGAYAALADAFDDLNLQPGQWYEVPNSRLESHFPNNPPPGITGPQAVMSAWSGGAYDSSRDRLIVWGGGHEDYAGNELYVFDVPNLQWIRLTEPSSSVSQNVSHYPDGLPTSRHTYNTLQYSPDYDYFMAFGVGSSYGNPSISSNSVDAYHFSDGEWIRLADKPSYGYTIGSFSAFDPSTGYFWHHGALNGRLCRYRPAVNLWDCYAQRDLENYITADVDPVRHLLVGVGDNQGVLVWNLNNPAASSQRVTTGGNKTLESRQAPGFVFDPALSQFVGWSGGRTIYLLDPGTWQWSEIQGTGATPTSADPAGTYGRFRYMPSKNAYIAVNKTNQNVYLFKLTAGLGATLPRINLSASPAIVQVGGSSTVSWTVSNADSCTASGGGLSGSVDLSGSHIVGPLNEEATISLSCSQADGPQLIRRVTVCVGECVVATGVDDGEDPEEEDESGSGALGWWVLLLWLGLVVLKRWNREEQS